MYTPTSFAETDECVLIEFLQQNSFAVLVSQSAQGPQASHLPILFEQSPSGKNRLVGHMAKANPQWKQADQQPVLAIFHGPHAYVTPTWYGEKNVVPTWNYVSVHVSGQLRFITERDRLRDLLDRTVSKYEQAFPTPWSADQPDQEFVDRLLEAIVGFEIEITQIEGQWKLSQNHSVERRSSVIDGLRARNTLHDTAIADLMEQAGQRSN